MAYIEQSLSAGEEIVGIFRLHWFAWMPVLVWAIVGLLTFGLLLPVAIYQGLALRFLEQGVTNKRVIRKTGIISRRTDEMKLGAIETIEIEQGIFGRILGFGTLKITGRGISNILLRAIEDPMAVKRRIEDASAPAG